MTGMPPKLNQKPAAALRRQAVPVPVPVPVDRLMLCFNDNPQAMGFARVPAARLIECCESKIQSIKNARANSRNGLIAEILESKIWWWNRIWRYFGFYKPTEAQAIKEFESDIRLCMGVDLMYSMQENKCQELLRLARNSERQYVWISQEAAAFCAYTSGN